MNKDFVIKKVNKEGDLIPHILCYDNHIDKYLSSPYYYFMTGRNGLYIFKNKSNSILFCCHPNQIGTILIFPPVNKQQCRLIYELVISTNLEVKNKKARIIRCGVEEKNIITSNTINNITSLFLIEDILDWKYPSVVISVEEVLKLRGRKFKDLRYNINKIDESLIICSIFNPTKHLKGALTLAKKWSYKNTSSVFDFDNLYAPYDYILNNYNKLKGLIGVVLHYKNKLVAFNILDRPLNNNTELTSLAFLADVDYPGIPSYMRYAVCKILDPMRIKIITIGGSETYGLYKFKKKLAPILELHLNSADIINSMS